MLKKDITTMLTIEAPLDGHQICTRESEVPTCVRWRGTLLGLAFKQWGDGRAQATLQGATSW